MYELHWVRVGSSFFVAGLYHPPRPVYKPEEFLDYIEECVEEICREFPAAHIVLAGDFNQLSDYDLVGRTGQTQIVYQPTCGDNILDRVYVSNPQLYSTVRVVVSIVRSDHKAMVAFPEGSQCMPKSTTQHTFSSPARSFLEPLSQR